LSEPRGAGTTWDPGQYEKFAGERLRPALELAARVGHAAPGTVYDLGCGTGEGTRLLAERWPGASVTGVDHSAEMIEKAQATPGRVRWIRGDLRDWRPDGAADVLFSNATLHWIDDHESLFPRLLGWLAPDGWLAVQMPLSWGAPSHRLMRETLADLRLGSAELGASLARDWVLPADRYYDLLSPRARAVDLWETEVLQTLRGEDPVLAWVKGTGLRPVLHGLDEADRGVFLAEYARRLRDAYPRRADGVTLFPFRRLFLVARV